MTEAQYQAARKVMQSANYMRGMITKAKGEVAKWTALEDGYRRNLKPGQADGAKKALIKAMERLDKERARFKALQLPGEDARMPTKWIVAIDIDSYNCVPKEIGADRFEEAEKDGYVLFHTKEQCQTACDHENSL